MMGLAVMVWLAAAPAAPTAVQRIDGAGRADFGALRPTLESEDPAVLAAYLRYLGRVPEPESVEVAKTLYARLSDPALKALAVAALQPKLMGAPDDTVQFLASVFAQEPEPVRIAALKKLAEVGTPAAAIAAVRYEPQTEAEVLAQLDALTGLRAHAEQKIAALARQHARSKLPKVAEKAKALVALMKHREP